MPIEESANLELESHKDDYFDYLEKKVSRLYGDSSDIEQLLNLIENERLLNALMRLDDERRKLIFWRIMNGLSFAEISNRLHMPEKKTVDTYYNTLKKLRKEIQNG